ncbi:MAG: hypothetical protein P1U78_03245 [Alcanivoracaceae bacterium]|nr:hypothetical protein [Alcanivoracaceae bacterium]
MKPSDHGLKYDDVILSASDGSRLHGWWLHASGEHKATLYFLHDLSGNVSDYLEEVSALPGKGIGIFMLDYRGFGLSEGRSDLSYVASDAVQGLDWLRVAGKAGSGAIVVLLQRQAIDPVKAELSKEIHSGRFDCLLEADKAVDFSVLLAQQCPAIQRDTIGPQGDDVEVLIPELRPAVPGALPEGPRFSF